MLVSNRTIARCCQETAKLPASVSLPPPVQDHFHNMKLSMAVGSLLLSLSSPTTSSNLPAAGTRRTGRHHGNDNAQKSTPHSPHGLQWRSQRGLSSPLLSNRPKLDNPVECIPDEEITEANVGVLGCSSVSADQVCRASVDSSLGGFCYSSSSFMDTRSLQYQGYIYGACDPTSPDYQRYDCDCSDFDNTTNTGSISCRLPTQNLGSQIYGCYDAFITPTGTTSFVNGTSGEVEDCYEIVAPTTSSSLCLQFPVGYGSCEAQLDGQVCASCAYQFGISLNCSNVVGADWGDQVPNAGFLISLPIIQACYQPRINDTVAYCDLCGDGGGSIYANNTKTISLEGFGDAFSCYDLQLASWSRQILIEKCPETAAVAQAECCFPPPSSMAPSSSTGTTAPISTPVDTTVAPGAGPPPPTAAPNSSTASASAIVPLCSSMMWLTGVLLLFSIIE